MLAITGILFASAIVVFQGQQAKTSLTQTMYDFASKLQSYVTEVNSGIYNGSSTYSCDVSGGKAVLSTGSGTLGSDQSCVFVGRVLQFIAGNSDVYVYTVIGNRDAYSGANDTGVTAKTLEETNPQIASVNGNMVLVDKYSFPSDITFSTGASTASDGTALNGYGNMFGLYEDLSGSGTGTNLEAIAFPFSDGANNQPYSPAMASCVSLNGNCASNSNGYGGSGYQRIASFKVCMQEGGGAQAEVQVKTSSAGITTQVDSQSCS